MKILSFNKYTILAGLLLAAAGALVSCKKLIEIPANPPTAITRTQQFADSTTAMSAVAGVYTYYNAGVGFGYSDANLTITTGLSADELSSTTNTVLQQFYSYNLTALNSNISTLWRSPYQAMYQINDVIGGVAGNSKLSASFVKQITGEMKVVRALYYFNLVNLFGGVPLVTSTDYKTTTGIPRSSIAAVYTQIMADLTDACTKLPASYPGTGRARPNLYTALTLLAKVNLYQGNWQAAYDEADLIIKSGMYSVTNTPVNGVFLSGSTEAIWQIPSIQSSTATTEASYFVPGYAGAIPTYPLSTFLLNQFETGDKRLQNWVGTAIVNTQELHYPYKYKNLYATDTPVEDYMIFRLGEVLLIRAEAAAHLAGAINLNQALADVNTIRLRAGLLSSTTDVTSQTAVLNAVMKERQTELFCEWGNRWFDLKRTGMAETVLSAEKTGWQNNAALYPIPQAQLQLDNLLTQNPGYN